MGEPTPRPFAIQRRDLINYGYTPGCPGCYAAANDRKYRPHTNECRRRIEDTMAKDEVGDNRVKAARERENAWLEKQVREGEITAGANRSEPTPTTPKENAGQPGIGAHIPRESQEEQDLRNADLQNRQLDEDNFHEIVNDDEQMYDDIEAVPIDDDNMVNQILSIVKSRRYGHLLESIS